jgi:uncharacterized membrane protein
LHDKCFCVSKACMLLHHLVDVVDIKLTIVHIITNTALRVMYIWHCKYTYYFFTQVSILVYVINIVSFVMIRHKILILEHEEDCYLFYFETERKYSIVRIAIWWWVHAWKSRMAPNFILDALWISVNIKDWKEWYNYTIQQTFQPSRFTQDCPGLDYVVPVSQFSSYCPSFLLIVPVSVVF